MRVTPVKKYLEPDFPTRLILDERPELLRFVPKRWQTNPVVIAALTGMCALTLGARAIADNDTSPGDIRVAPVFEHGGGKGAFGCVSVNPPALFSEADARQVIVEEAKRSGIDFNTEGESLRSLSVPPALNYNFTDAGRMGKPAPTRVLTMDGTDETRDISFEFVSIEDHRKWDTRRILSTALSRDFREAAERLRDSLTESKERGIFAVFYDPCVNSRDVERETGFKIDQQAADRKAEYEKMREKTRELAREDLRKQVQDFIKWLKAQGVI